MNQLDNLEPKAVFHFFREICQIPHTSYHEKKLSDYCVRFAAERKLPCIQDEIGNIIITAKATPGYEEEDAIMIQGHLDMVGDKIPDCPLDLERDGLLLKLDGDYLMAEGTTLGGDDGIAVAYALAVLDAGDIPHPRLEVVLTVREEVGLLGASAIDVSSCRARRLLNIDSEVEGVLTVGCCGGRRVCARIPVSRQQEQGLCCKITFDKLLGGHSGLEIHKERVNAVALMGRFLLYLSRQTKFYLVRMCGGSKENAIPNAGHMTVLISPGQQSVLEHTVEEFLADIRTEYAASDPDVQIAASIDSDEIKHATVLTEASLNRVMTALSLTPTGVQTINTELAGQVETSLNLGVMELTEDELVLRLSIRSSYASAKEALAEKIRLLTEMLGGTVAYTGEYPAWTYARKSKLRELCVDIYRQQYGRAPLIQTMHAGLECGILSNKIPGLDCISFGPDLLKVHTPNERMSISSVARTWDYLKAILAAKTKS